MEKFGKFIVKFRRIILIVAVLLLIPAGICYINTKVNYDLLYYLPDEIDTMKGQDIMMDEFGAGAFSMVVLENMDYEHVAELKSKIEDVEHVEKVIWYDSFLDTDIPAQLLPDSLYDAFNTEDSTLMMVIFNDSSSGEGTMKAIGDIKKIAGKECFVSGISAIVADTRDLAESETPIYVVLASVISCIVMGLLMDSFLIPVLFLLSIGMAIVYNLGSNVVVGEISYVTKALAAVLQLGVTMDYSIFLWHSYEECREIYDTKEEAMAKAIAATITSVVGSSITTIAGFIALCFMSFTLGLDLGVVMAKGVLLGVIGCVTILPALILGCDKAINRMRHKSLVPNTDKISKFIIKRFPIFIVIMLALIAPAIYGYTHTDVYYDLTLSLPENLDSVVSTKVLQDKYDLSSANMILVNSDMASQKIIDMVDEIDDVPGVSSAIAMEKITGADLPKDFLPESLSGELRGENYEMILLASEYKTGSDEANEQCNSIEKIIKKYDENGMLVGEAACTRDLINITNEDFKRVSAVSIGVIFIIIAVIYGSVLLPVLLVALIEFAIIVIGTIQLGATVDYAILMTTRYRKERNDGKNKKEAVGIALHTSIPSIIASALSFFGATFGVGVYSSIDMISSLCTLMARGAIISMISVICILPAMFMLFDKLIIKTSLTFKNKRA